MRRRARDILAAIERGRAAPPIRLDDGERLATDAVDGPTIALAEALVRARAQEAGLAYELIAARADLAPIVVAARRAKPSRTCARCAAGAASWSATSCSSCSPGDRRLAVVNGRVRGGLEALEQRLEQARRDGGRRREVAAGEQQAVDDRPDEHVDRELEVDVVAQLAAVASPARAPCACTRRRGSTSCA